MAFNGRIEKTPFLSGKNILASEHVQFVEGGATLAGGQGALAVGELVARDATTGKWVKYNEANAANYDDFGILNIDVDTAGGDVVVGEIIVRGSVYEAKLPTAPTATFKDKTPNIRYVKHV